MSRRLLQNAVYSLKMSLGEPIIINYPLAAPDYDPTLGLIDRLEGTIKVRRAIVFDKDQYRKFAYDLAYIAAAKEFTSGAYYNSEFRGFLCDDKDLGQPIQVGWEIEYNGSKYTVDKVRGYQGYTMLVCIAASAEAKAGV